MRIAVRAAEIAADWTQLKSLDAKAESGTNAMKAVTKVVPALRNKLLSEVLIYFFPISRQVGRYFFRRI